MPTHKFEYVVSGVELNEAQKSAISAAIGTAVTQVLVGGPGQAGHLSDLLKGKVWGTAGGGIGPRNGGWVVFADNHAALPQAMAKAIQG